MSHQVRRNLVRKLPPHQAKSAILGDLSRCTWGRLRRPRDTVANRPPNMYGWAVSKALHRSDSSRRFSGGIAGSVSITARSIRSERVAISSIPLRTTGRVPSKLSPLKDAHQSCPNSSTTRVTVKHVVGKTPMCPETKKGRSIDRPFFNWLL